MYVAYHHSRFLIRFVCTDESKKEDTLQELLKHHNAYNSTNISREDVRLIPEHEMPSVETLVNLSTFHEFAFSSQLKQRIEDLPFPKGLQVKIDRPLESVKESEKTREKSMPVYSSNLKVWFNQNNEASVKLARQVSKWLMITDTNILNVKCTYKSYDRIVLECMPVGGNSRTLTKEERWGPLYTPKIQNAKKGVFSSNCEIRVWQQFRHLDYFTEVIRGVTIPVQGYCVLESVGLSTVHLRYTLRNGEPDGEQLALCKLSDYILRNVNIPGYTLVEKSRGWIYQPPLKKFYLVVIDVTEKTVRSPQTFSQFKIQNENELNDIIEEGLAGIAQQSHQLDEEQSSIQYYVEQVSINEI